MKYIRTKDGIEKMPNDYADKLIETPTLKVADTIEELCDEFVSIIPYLPPLLEREFWNDELNRRKYHSFREYVLEEKGILFGAIWTDKGLIYVAKMNDKGELELL